MHKRRFSLQNPIISNNNNNNNNKPSFSTNNSIKRKNACPKGSYSPTLKNENGDFICDDAAQEMFKYVSKFDKLTRKNSSFPKFSLCCDKESFYSTQNQSRDKLETKSIREQLRRQAQEEEKKILEKEAKDEERHSRLSSLRPSTSRKHTIEKIITSKRKRESINNSNGSTKKNKSSITNNTKTSVKHVKPKKNVRFKNAEIPPIQHTNQNIQPNLNQNSGTMDLANWGNDPNDILGLLTPPRNTQTKLKKTKSKKQNQKKNKDN